jgi:branched-chain amino acid transport system permease protein
MLTERRAARPRRPALGEKWQGRQHISLPAAIEVRMSQIIHVVISGLLSSAILFMFALGLTLVLGVMNVLNVAHGGLYALGAYFGAWLSIILVLDAGLNPWLTFPVMIIAALIVGVVVGALIERIFLRFCYGREHAVQLIVTFAALLIIENAILKTFGGMPIRFSAPARLLGTVQILGVTFPFYYFFVMVLAAMSGVLLSIFMNRATFGKSMVAVTADEEMASAMGIKVRRIYILAFSIGAGLAGMAGAFNAPLVSVAQGLPLQVIVTAFAIVVIGGFGSIKGAALGALTIGIGQAIMLQIAPEVELLIIYLVMGIVLVFRPLGLYGKQHARLV